ncbi:MAG: hypothetical protein H6Q59_1166 [Firmicutes bacterium]|nr:hypothetical protein [Bacillota bacterium]
MNIYQISKNTAPLIAKLMNELKPDWWSSQGALEQITADNVIGWYMAENQEEPVGWMCIKRLDAYSCAELYGWGMNDNGSFHTDEKMALLYDYAESYVKEAGLRNIRTTMTSLEMSCHGRQLGNYAEELKNLSSCGRKHFDYLESRSYQPAGFVPNCYGDKFHGIIMLKDLTK